MTPALAFAALLRPQVIDWGRLPIGSAPVDPGGRTPRVALAFPLLFRGTVIDWGWTPRGALDGTPAPSASDWLNRFGRRAKMRGR